MSQAAPQLPTLYLALTEAGFNAFLIPGSSYSAKDSSPSGLRLCKGISDTTHFLSSSLFLFFGFWFLGLHPQHMEVPRLGVKSELELPAYATATALWDLSCL